MKIKRFFAKDMRAGLAEVKAELGEDAVIMQNRKVTGGVEIVAAVEDTSNPVDEVARSMSSGGSSRDLASDQVRIGGRQKADKAHGPQTASKEQQQPPVSSLQELLARQSRQNSDSQQPSALAALMSQPVTAGGSAGSKGNSRREKADSDAAGPTRLSDSSQRRIRRKLASHSSYFQQLQADAEQKGEKWEPKTSFLTSLAEEKEASFKKAAAKVSRDQESKSDRNEFELLRQELQSVRQMLEQQVSGLMWQEVERREPMRAFVIKQLGKLGVAEPIADQITAQVPENITPDKAWAVALDALSDQIQTSGDEMLERGGVVALLGPTGVGKTTTLAKLAARFAMRYGAEQVGLITTDTYRIGAHEQLATYGRIMGCPVRVAGSSEEFNEAMSQMASRRLILIDTAGMGQRDTRLAAQLDALVADSGKPIRNYLVLPSTAQRQVLEETIEHFQRVPIDGCIFTKLDECLSLGELFSVAIQYALSISYVTDGQRVPEDIKAANAHYLVSQAVDMFTRQSKRKPSWMAAVEPHGTGSV